jgi:BirA family biotin operon repressor/biotin-[acetyl-CoA-carboxylase] ligase
MTAPAAIHYFERLVSTMDLLHSLAADGAAAGTVVRAGEQTSGRGSRGRIWLSPPGGLWLSVLLRPSSASALDLLSLRIGLAVSQRLSDLVGGAPIRLKWPNDLMLGDRKAGGILCEARWQGETLAWVAVGLGLNVANRVPDGLAEVATTLADHAPGIVPDSLVEPVVATVVATETDSARLSEQELERFEALDWLLGRSVRSPVAGVAAGIASDGALRVALADGRELAVRAGPVELAAAPVRT